MTGLAIAMTLDGSVSRHLSKPEGKWYDNEKEIYLDRNLGQSREKLSFKILCQVLPLYLGIVATKIKPYVFICANLLCTDL